MGLTLPVPDGDYFSYSLEEIERLPVNVQKKWLVALQRKASAPTAITEGLGRSTPQEFITNVLGAKPTEAALSHGITVPWTPDQDRIMEAASSIERDQRRILVWSGNSVGKSFCMSQIALWFLFGEEDTIVITTAPNARQVEQLLWGEIRRAYRTSEHTLPGRCLQTKIELAEKWYAAGYTARIRTGDSSATAFQGVHSKRVVVIIDEATDVAQEIWQAAERITTGPRDKIIAIGNPTDPSAVFVTNAELKRPDGTPMWHKIVTSAADHPNVTFNDPEIIPGAATTMFVEDMLHMTGSESSGVYRSAILGLPPTENPDTLISLTWIQAAQRRYEKLVEETGSDTGKEDLKGAAIGLDIAGTGSDLTVLSLIRNGVWTIPKLKNRRAWHQGRDVEECAELLWDALHEIPNVRVVVLDDTGIGAAITARYRKWREGQQRPKDDKRPLPKYTTTDGEQADVWLMPVNFGAPSELEKFDLVKDEMWWTLRESFRENLIIIPPEQVVQTYTFPRGTNVRAQISAPIYANPHGGRIQVYDKRGAHNKVDLTKNLPAKSPDVAHSMMLARYGFTKLRADPKRARPVPTNVQELFASQTAEMIDKAKDQERREKHDRGIKKNQPAYARKRR